MDSNYRHNGKNITKNTHICKKKQREREEKYTYIGENGRRERKNMHI